MLIPENTNKLYNFQYTFHLFKNIEICMQAIIPLLQEVLSKITNLLHFVHTSTCTSNIFVLLLISNPVLSFIHSLPKEIPTASAWH
jgi:hypothetical protein